MSKELKVYEIEASITLDFNFEVDAKNKTEARALAQQKLEDFMVQVKREYDAVDIYIDSVEESEGH